MCVRHCSLSLLNINSALTVIIKRAVFITSWFTEEAWKHGLVKFPDTLARGQDSNRNSCSDGVVGLNLSCWCPLSGHFSRCLKRTLMKALRPLWEGQGWNETNPALEVIPYHLLSNWLSKARRPGFLRVLTATPEAALASLSSPEEKIQGWERSRQLSCERSEHRPWERSGTQAPGKRDRGAVWGPPRGAWWGSCVPKSPAL